MKHYPIGTLKIINFAGIEYPSVPHRPSQFNTSVPHKEHTFSAPKIPQFNTPQFNTPSVQHPLSSTSPSIPHPLSSTPPQFKTSLRSTLPSAGLYRAIFCRFFVLNWGRCWTEACVELRRVLNWGVCVSEGCVEVRGFRCWTEGFLGLKRSGPFVWNRCVELLNSFPELLR